MARRRFPIFSLLLLLLALLFITGVYLAIPGNLGPRNSIIRSRLYLLDTLMQQYQTTNPPLTTATNPDPASSWVQAIQSCPQTAPQIRHLISELNHRPVILDTFGTPIEFTPADQSRNHRAYFHSAGRDTVMDTADDIFSTGI